MKIKKELIKRNIAGDIILVPVGSASLDLKGLITLNEAAEVIWDALPEAESADDLVKAITEVYDVDAETAAQDVNALLEKLRELDFSRRELKALSVFYDILDRLLSEQLYTDSAIIPAVNYISENLYNPELDNEKAAAAAEISESYMRRLFKKKYGMPPLVFKKTYTI